MTKALSRFPATTALLVAIFLVYGLEVLAGGSSDPEVLYRFGANLSITFATGQYWRLLASLFLHIGVLHLFMNTWVLYQLGGLTEALFGTGRFLVLYFLSGLGGSVASTLFMDARGLSAGASGAIFGLLGALLVFLASHRDRLTPQARRLFGTLLFWAAFNLFLGFTVSAIDNAGHIGGLLTGGGLGLLLRAPIEQRASHLPEDDDHRYA